jgi:hypothetical protein
MSITLYSIQALLLPAMVIAGYYGWRRGLFREFGNFLALLVGLAITTGAGGQALVGIVNRGWQLGPRILNLLVGRGEAGQQLQPLISDDPFSFGNWLFRLVVFLVILFSTYRYNYPWELDAKGAIRKPVTLYERPLGAIFGAGIGLVLFAAFQEFFNGIFLIQGRSVPLQRPRTLTIVTPQGIDSILALVPTLGAIAFIVLIILTIFNFYKIWR